MIKNKLSAFLWGSVVMAAVFCCTSLGFWQLARAEQKEQRQQQLMAWQEKGVVPLSSVLNVINQAVDASGMQVSFSGSLFPHYWLLDNQVYQGKVGYDVLVLVRPHDTPHYVLVNLGFTPAGFDRNTLPTITLPDELNILGAQIKEGDLAQLTLAKSPSSTHWPKRIQSIDIEQMSHDANVPLLDFMAYAKHTQPQQPMAFHYKSITMSAQKHRGYALQWFLIAASALVVALFAVYKAKRSQHE